MIDNDVNNEIHQGDNDGKICSADNKAHDNPILHNEPTMKTADFTMSRWTTMHGNFCTVRFNNFLNKTSL